jgi:hypothetical protein
MTSQYPAVRVHSLWGAVVDPSDAPMRFVLVERMTIDYKTRLQATFTDDKGRFHFQDAGKETHYLRFRFRALRRLLGSGHWYIGRCFEFQSSAQAE